MTAVEKIKSRIGNAKWYRFLNFNFNQYLDYYGGVINETDTYNDYHKNYIAYLKKHFQHPYYIDDQFTYSNYKLGIYESLRTHDINQFANKINEYVYVYDISNVNETGVLEVTVIQKEFDNFERNSLLTLCRLYGYYIVNEEYSGPFIIFTIETTYGLKDKTDFVYNQCNGVLYHITAYGYKDKILRKGLIPKHLDKKVSHPGRIYCVTTSDIDELTNLGKQLYNNKKYIVFKINLNKHPLIDNLTNKPVQLSFYTDPAYETFGVFTCENIPPQCLQLYNIESFLKPTKQLFKNNIQHGK